MDLIGVWFDLGSGKSDYFE